jgi:hypothetical protein
MGTAHRTLLGAVMFAVVAGGASAGYAAGPTPTPDPVLAQQVAEWVTGGGAADLKALGADFTELEKAASAEDLVRMGAGCQHLLQDVHSAQAHDPIPDPKAEKDWANALNLYEQGAADCANGAQTQNYSLISQASDEIIQGSSDLDNVTARLKEISGR